MERNEAPIKADKGGVGSVTFAYDLRRRKGSKSSALSQGSSTHASSKQKVPRVLRTSRTVVFWRIIFTLVLASTAAILGYAAFRSVRDSEEALARQRFDSIAERALSVAQLVMEEKKKATDALALMVATSNPSAESWPNVYMEGYEEIARSLRIVTQGSLSFCAIVRPGGEEQEQFEDFAYDFFENVQQFEGAGESDFGQGIWAYGKGQYWNETWSDYKYHVTSDWTPHGSDVPILVPFLQSDFGYHSVLMLDLHNEVNRAVAIDNAYRCSEERAAAGDFRECGSITELMWTSTAAKDVKEGPGGIIFDPIYPRNNNQTLTGFIVGKQLFSDLLLHAFERDVAGLYVVIRTDTNPQGFTYTVTEGGEVQFKSNGTVIDENPKFKDSRALNNATFFSNSTRQYYIDIYSSDEFIEEYYTDNPRRACIGVVAIIVGMSILFFLYDYVVRKEFQHKRTLLEAKRRFVRFISHEVRTPLNTVSLGLTIMKQEYADFLENGNPSESTSRRIQTWADLSDQVATNADSAVAVLSDLLQYDKIHSGMLKLELSQIHIWQLLRRVVSEFKIAAREANVVLELDLSPLLEVGNDFEEKKTNDPSVLPEGVRYAIVIGDAARLAQVFRNLISNGLKFSKTGKNLIVRAREAKKHKAYKDQTFEFENEEKFTFRQRSVLEIQVIDQGVGMTREQVRTVFDDGTQFNSNKFQAGGGSGLGLNIARGIVLQHRGDLCCDSRGMGKGTTFTLEIPLFDSNDTTTPVSTEDYTSMGDTTTIREQDLEFTIPELKILVVDDAITNRKLCIRLLESNGHSCDGAVNGQEAVEKVHESSKNGRPYDCILLDYEMPIMNGPTACKLMREMGCNSYIAGVTGNLLSEDVELFRDCGANWVLAKPFRLEQLEQQLVEFGFGSHRDAQSKSAIVRVESDKDLENVGASEPLEIPFFSDDDESSGGLRIEDDEELGQTQQASLGLEVGE